MSLDPAVAARLMKDVPEMQAFVRYVTVKAAELDTLTDIALSDPIEYTIEAKARLLAYKKLGEILSPLINTSEISSHNTSSEYVV